MAILSISVSLDRLVSASGPFFKIEINKVVPFFQVKIQSEIGLDFDSIIC